jgi:uncharacterized protein (TIGR02246 family)
MTRTVVLFSLFVRLLTNVVGQTPSETEQAGAAKDRAKILSVLADFTDAWNRHDARAFSMLFAQDADFTNVRGTSAHGRTQIETFHVPSFATKFKDTHQTITETKVRLIKPDVAAVDARWEMTGAKGSEGQDLPLRKGLLNFVMTKEGGEWVITVMHNMDLAP